MDRRGFLGTTAAAGALSLAGCAGVTDLGRRPGANRGRGAADRTTTEAGSNGGADTDPADFVWAEQALWRDERVRENLFAFAGRHDLAVVIAKADAGIADIPALEAAFTVAESHGVEAWINVGVLKSLDATAFVADAGARRRHLDGLAAVVASYAESFPTGRVVLWQEAPVGGRWVESGDWNDQAVSNLERFGPRIFAAQRERVAEVAPEVDIGVFVHFPYLVDGKQPKTFAGLADGLRARGALPDFTFTDFYRGWYAKDVGPEPASRAVESLVTNARTATDGRPVTFLGQAHTIDPRYTPSKQDVWMDLRAALGAGAEGVGWYARTAYTPTERGFDPLLPNHGPAARDGPHASTLTFARDRYQYAYAALRSKRRHEGTGSGDDPVDLWLVGRGFSFYDHRLSVRTRDDGWTFLGDFDGYLDGNYPYGRDGRSVSIFRGLPRERFAPDGRLECRVKTRPRSDGAHLSAALAMPTNVACFLTEGAAAAADDRDLEPFSAGHATVDEPLTAGGSTSVALDLTAPDQPMEMLAFPNHRTQRRRLRRLESHAEFVPAKAFDLWIRTEGANDAIDPNALSLVGNSGARKLGEASTTVSTAPEGSVFYGLSREGLGHEDGSPSLELAGDARDRVASAYAMPYAGLVAFRPAGTAMRVLDADPAAARTYAIAFVGE
ncbi:hypothetical protein [Halococcus hamelinensis]|uniref:Uncharacterized protein n=1 Tax=Halococcus hamelinensis 100A6 TaxID=1132509 RepID=M0M463_9EURY|nr:hypothetical protein [Halococcus hamelinensis]EMA40203.1 hypothetical protein C447_04707 [Halococcus hamelinensis 100A6]